MMPEMDGFEFLAEFRKNPKFASTPVIVVTAADLSLRIAAASTAASSTSCRRRPPARRIFCGKFASSSGAMRRGDQPGAAKA